MATLLADLHSAVRSLCAHSSRAVSLFVIVTVAMGLGAIGIVITIADAVLVRPLAVHEAQRLVLAQFAPRGQPLSPSNAELIPFSVFEVWRGQVTSVTGLAGYAIDYVSLAGGEETRPRRITAVKVTANVFDLLGVRPALGRGFRPEDDAAGASRTTVISHRFWSAYLSGDSGIVGQTILLDGLPYRVLGVMPDGFRIPYSLAEAEKELAELWVPVRSTKNVAEFTLTAIGRLRNGRTAADLEAELDRITSEAASGSQEARPAVIPVRSIMTARVRRPLLLVAAAALCVLIVSIANVSILLLARLAARSKELAVRAALGATRVRLQSLLVWESSLLVFAGAALGGLVAWVGVPTVVREFGTELPDVGRIVVNWRVLGGMLPLVGLCIVGTTMLPSAFLRWDSAGAAMRDAGQDRALSRGVSRAMASLVLAEVAIAMGVFATTGHVSRSLSRLIDSEQGFDHTGVAVATVFLRGPRYDARSAVPAFATAIQKEVSGASPAITVAVSTGAPVAGSVVGLVTPVSGNGLAARVPIWSATPELFSALRLRLVRGQLPTGDNPNGAVLDVAAVERFFQATEPIGQQVRVGNAGPLLPVVAVVATIEDIVAAQGAPGRRRVGRPHVIVPFNEHPGRLVRIVVRTELQQKDVATLISNALTTVDPTLSEPEFTTLTDLLRRRAAREGFLAYLLSGFAFLTIAMAVSGLYALLSFATTQRMREYGIRLALGASRWNVLRLAIGRTVALVSLGIAVGCVAVAAIRSTLTAVLFEAPSVDFATLAWCSAGLVVVAALSGFMPVRRALRSNPTVVLKG